MKKHILIIFFILTKLLNNGFAQNDISLLGKIDQFLQAHVQNGLVNYQAIKNDTTELNLLLASFSDLKISTESHNSQKALLINAYNIFVIKQIAANYPLKSPMDVEGFFDQTKFRLAGQSLTLNAIENDWIRKEFPDARIHFALVCGAIGCPKLMSEAFRAEGLDEQLIARTSLALNDPAFIRIKDVLGEVAISEIFKWYKSDFLAEEKDEITFINKYRLVPVSSAYSIRFYDYNWALNELNIMPASENIEPPADPIKVVSKTELSPPEITLDESPTSVSEVLKTSPNNSAEEQEPIVKQPNIRVYTPSVLLAKHQIELKHFSNLYTQTQVFYPESGRGDIATRDSYYTGVTQFTYGVSEKARINIGLDINLKSVFIDTTQGSPLRVLGAKKSSFGRTAISSIGPRIKFQPLEAASHLSVQSTVLVPIATQLEGPDYAWLAYDMFTFWNQLFFDKTIVNGKGQLFTEADLWFKFPKHDYQSTLLSTPVSVFLSYFATDKNTVYGLFQYAPTFGTIINYETQEENFGLKNYYAQYGLGSKYQITAGLEIELLYTNFFKGSNWAGAGATFNIGLRYLH